MQQGLVLGKLARASPLQARPLYLLLLLSQPLA